MYLKTIQASAFKSVFEVLKDIINDVNCYFTEKGLHVLTLDTARVTLVHMILGAENFEEYECPTNIIAGLNMSNLYKILKSVTTQDTLTISIKGRDYMELVIENTSKKSFTNFKLKLLDINEDQLDLPDVQMDLVTTMASIDFQRYTRDMGNLSNEISIFRKDSNLVLSCTGDFADQETILDSGGDFSGTVGGVFSLKYINLFTKATNMCSSIQIMQDSTNENMPIVFRYTIANLGDLKFYLAPRID